MVGGAGVTVGGARWGPRFGNPGAAFKASPLSRHRQFAALPAPPPCCTFDSIFFQVLETGTRDRTTRRRGVMASNYVDTAGEEGRFHGRHHHSSGTTPTGAAASPKMRRSWSSAASASSGGGHGSAPKCVCAPATHAGSFKCRLHRSSSHGHGHGHPSSSPTATAPAAAVQSSSSRTVAAQ